MMTLIRRIRRCTHRRRAKIAYQRAYAAYHEARSHHERRQDKWRDLRAATAELLRAE